ncbi:MAG: hypothetical protein ACTSUE_18795, partial [Promethearchaeota archaeon]
IIDPNFDKFRSIDFCTQCDSVFLLMHGKHDKTILIQSIYDIEDAILKTGRGTVWNWEDNPFERKENSNVVQFPKGGHNNLNELYRDEKKLAVHEFVDHISKKYLYDEYIPLKFGLR